MTVVMLPALASAVTGSAVLQIEFPGMRYVHTDVRQADGISGEATGTRITSSNWKVDGTTIEVPPGVYDLELEFRDDWGTVLSRETLADVEITAGEFSFYNRRVF